MKTLSKIDIHILRMAENHPISDKKLQQGIDKYDIIYDNKHQLFEVLTKGVDKVVALFGSKRKLLNFIEETV